MKSRNDIRLLDEGAPPAGGCTVLDCRLSCLGAELALRVQVPDARASLADVVPLARSICDLLTGLVERDAAARGLTISCRKGCGDCCTNYLVPMTAPEAFRLLDDLGALGDGERRRLEAAFTAAAGRLEASGLCEVYRGMDPADADSPRRQRDLAGKWWSANRFPCPLLRDAACSHYPLRPMPCREFLVTSPPDNCRNNSETRLHRPFAMHSLLSRWAAELEGTRGVLVLLPNFLAWVQGKSARRQRTWRAPLIVRRFLDILAEAARRGAAGTSSDRSD